MTGGRPYLTNRFRDPAFRPGPPDPAVRAFHRSLPGYAATPLIALPGLARDLGVGDLRIKDESSRFGLPAFKALGASWAGERLRSVRGGMPAVLSTASAGNFGRAVAWTARRFGVRAVIYLSERSVRARVDAIRGEGAEVVLVEGSYDDAVRRCAEESAERGWQVLSDTGYPGYLEIPTWIQEGYGTMLAEIDEQLSGVSWPDTVLIQGGVGGLAAAVVTHARRRGAGVRVTIVEPEDADCLFVSADSPDGTPTESTGAQRTIMAGLNCRAASHAAWPILRAGADGFLRIGDRHAEDAVRRLSRPVAGDPAMAAGESGAAGIGALVALAEDPGFAAAREALGLTPASRVLVVSTEGVTDPEGVARILGGSVA